MPALSYASAKRDATLLAALPTILHKAALPLLLHFLVLLLHPAKSTLRNTIALPIIWGLSLDLLLHHTSRHWGLAFCVGAYAFFVSLQAFNLLIAHDVANDSNFRWYALAVEDAQFRGWWTRVQWTTSLLCGSRGIGWAYKPRGGAIPSDSPSSRTQFFGRSLLELTLCYLYLDFYSWLMATDPIYHNPSCWDPLSVTLQRGCYPDFADPENTGLPGSAYIYSNARKFCTLFGIYAVLTQLYTTAAILFTALGITAPSSWPSLYGSLRAATSLRGFWGYYWHQSFRTHFAWPGIWLSNQLGLTPKSPASQSILLFTAFLCSGLLHSIGCYTQARNGLFVIIFFLIQPLGMAVESLLPKSLRLPWMLVWLLWTCNFFFKEYLDAGIGSTEPVPVSLWRGMSGEGWWRWGKLEDNMSWDDSAFGWGIAI